ncbi:uncharacterized protein L969DRAFT_53057 [Mixia osmundae IAM 14324]|uniref:Uncharacterized protein n=1 Tax=Mixia osmundae (strain CBS 9802 / IAM 14324 / JCM 22182 / KY 12970) TaxID=764103 RepID=G7DUY9_MIXOS|nr:uncharacterized protein L969DRAFT_53057 [Mixia osmundae IAM 14324]KEI37269.1 hypothetical protein L969DRAFT_53057 [Mixia osmundae IAM 14324]GAA94399.1 hypothetical protein E5Q_01051 [Mixia osmundae IAM 14324]
MTALHPRLEPAMDTCRNSADSELSTCETVFSLAASARSDGTLTHGAAECGDGSHSSSRSLKREHRYLAWLALLVCAILSGSTWTAAAPHAWYKPVSYEEQGIKVEPEQRFQTRSTCANPYVEPGFLEYSALDPLQTRWRPYLTECVSPPDYLELLRLACPTERTGTTDSEVFKADWLRYKHFDLSGQPERRYKGMTVGQIELSKESQLAYRELTWLRNKTVLILGDSIDRNALEHLATLTDQTIMRTSYENAHNQTIPTGWEERALPHIIHFKRLNLRIISNFFYGADDRNTFRIQSDWHPPGLFEDRVDQLFLPFIKDLDLPSGRPDYLSFATGLWDSAMFGRLDKLNNRTTETPLTTAQTDWTPSRWGAARRRYLSLRLANWQPRALDELLSRCQAASAAQRCTSCRAAAWPALLRFCSCMGGTSKSRLGRPSGPLSRWCRHQSSTLSLHEACTAYMTSRPAYTHDGGQSQSTVRQ